MRRIKLSLTEHAGAVGLAALIATPLLAVAVAFAIRFCLLVFAVHALRLPLESGEVLRLDRLVDHAYVQSIGTDGIVRTLPFVFWAMLSLRFAASRNTDG